jgi:hypothetical protein
MNATNSIATDLFYKIRSRFSGLKLGTAEGVITINPEEARFFDFDYMDDKVPVGHISISLAEENSMKVYFSTGITESMDGVQKHKWYGFLKELRQFAKRRLMAFDTRDIAKDNLDKRDFAFLSQHNRPKPQNDQQAVKPVGENIMSESTMYGTRTMSYQKLMDTRLIIKHSHALIDDQSPGARTRNISALFVENQDGERFKYPFIHLSGARAMQRHVANGGLPYDSIGKSIIKMSEEIAQLKSFSNYVVRNDLMNSDTNSLVLKSQDRLNSLREQIAKMAKQRHYEAYCEAFEEQSPVEVPQQVVEQFKDQFTVKNFKDDIASVFPILYKLTQEDSLGYDDIVAENETAMINDEAEVVEDAVGVEDDFGKFESWILNLGERSNIQSEDEDEKNQAISDLQPLVSQHFPAGVDGANAIESLKGIIEDPELYKQIKDQAKEDPDSCVRPLIKNWLETNAPDIIEELDFGDMVDEPAADQGGDQTAPEEEPQMADIQYEGDIDPNRHAQTKDYGTGDDLPFDADDEVSDKDEFGNTIKNKARHLAKKGMRQAMDVKELAEFINSFYDRNSGTFPKGPEGVVVMVGKKFGEQAEQVARKFVERMAPHQAQGAEELEELARIRELAGMKTEGDRIRDISPEDDLDDVGDSFYDEDYVFDLASRVFAMNPNLSAKKGGDQVVDAAYEIMVKDLGKKRASYILRHDEDFVGDLLDTYSRAQHHSTMRDQSESITLEDDNSDLRMTLIDIYKRIYNNAARGYDETDHIADDLDEMYDAVEASDDPDIKRGFEMVRATIDTSPEEQANALSRALLMLEPGEPDVEIDRESVELQTEDGEEEGVEDLLAAVEEEINEPGQHIDNLQDVMNATFDADDSPEYEKARSIINRYLELVTNADVDHPSDDPDDDEPSIRRMTHGDIARHIREYDLTDNLQHAAAMLDQMVGRNESLSTELEDIRRLSGISQGIGL